MYSDVAIHKDNLRAIYNVLCEADNDSKKYLFQRFFFVFSVQRNTFLNDYRPFIRIDGCHLKDKYGGVLLVVVALDANKGIVSLALCACKIENTKTWT